MKFWEWMDNVNKIWRDDNYLIRTKKIYANSGNGILESSILAIIISNYDPQTARIEVRAVYRRLQYKPGCLKRTPNNEYGPEAFDDYLGLMVACIRLGITDIPKEIFWFGLWRFFFYLNRGFSFKSWMILKPQVIALMFAAAYPELKFISYPLLWIAMHLIKFNQDPKYDSSGNQLSVLLIIAYVKLYNCDAYKEPIRGYYEWSENLTFTPYFLKSMQNYYDPDHAFLNLPDEIEMWPWK